MNDNGPCVEYLPYFELSNLFNTLRPFLLSICSKFYNLKLLMQNQLNLCKLKVDIPHYMG